MPILLFNHETLSHHCEGEGTFAYGHTFGGDPNAYGIRVVNMERSVHLVCRLNLADPTVGIELPGIRWLPMCYGFSYAAFDGTFIYRVLSDAEIEFISPVDAEFDADFPYPGYPRFFPESPVAFQRQEYDPTVAEDALSLAAVFGVDQLSALEMQRAIKIVEAEGDLFQHFEELPGMSPENVIRQAYDKPFSQGAPSKSCDNPNCTAEIAYRTDDMVIQLSDDDPDDDTSILRIDAHDVRRDTMRVFAIHEPHDHSNSIWGNSKVQLVFEICNCCHCIRVTNQCG